jgi:hypothetical protein
VETLWRIAGALDLSLSELFLMVEQAHLQEEHAYLITRS